MARLKSILDADLVVVNVGIGTFADDLRSQSVPVISVAWKPPAGGDVEMLKLLEKLGTGAGPAAFRKAKGRPGKRS
jgi:hypothetical protein